MEAGLENMCCYAEAFQNRQIIKQLSERESRDLKHGQASWWEKQIVDCHHLQVQPSHLISCEQSYTRPHFAVYLR